MPVCLRSGHSHRSTGGNGGGGQAGSPHSERRRIATCRNGEITNICMYVCMPPKNVLPLQVNIVAFDKTGTLTEGKPKVRVYLSSFDLLFKFLILDFEIYLRR